MQRSVHVLTIVVFSFVLTAPRARANEWVAHFTDFSGTNASSISNYTDLGGMNPRSYTVTFNGMGSVTQVGPWLSQGSISAIPTTAKFFNEPGTGSGRARFATPLPTSADLDGGISVAWRMRVGAANTGRGPFQVAGTAGGTVGEAQAFNAYIRLRNSGDPSGNSFIDIQRNGGGLYADLTGANDPLRVDRLILSSNLADQYHEWAAAIIRNPADNKAYWKLWLDGNLLLFSGPSGSPVFNSEQFSFSTFQEGFGSSGTNDPYIGLGDLNSQDVWDFEFDCVAYRDDGLSLFTCGGTLPPCNSTVSPSATQTATAIRGSTATPPEINYAFINDGASNVSYTVAETDAGGSPLNYPWLSLNKSGGGPVIPAGSDFVVATITDTTMAAGTHTAYITFTDTCSPAVQHIRRIDLIITDCASTVSPASESARSVTSGSVSPVANVVYTLTNTGVSGLTYTVAKEGGDCGWLTLDKSGNGPLANGQSDTVTGMIDPTGVPVGVHTCTVRFTNTTAGCSNAPADHLRTVTLHVLGPASGHQQFVAEFTTFTGSDEAASSPMISCDPSVTTVRNFGVETGNPLQVDQLDPGWLTQGSISATPTTARFFNPPGPSGVGTGVGRARFRAFLPFDNTFDPAKGMSTAWRMRVGAYAPTRAPIQITFPRVTGPFGTDGGAANSGNEFNVFVRLQNGTHVNILRNGGAPYAGINTLILPASIADEYHQWTASVCYDAGDQRAYWNLWLDGQKLLFTGSNADGSAGSPVGPGGQTFSFRTFLEDVSGDPYIGLGELQTSTDIWDFDFDWVRLLSYNVSGCPFWDGEGCVPAPLCNTPWADGDGDGDVDLVDFAKLQLCFTGNNPAPGVFDANNCRCLDRNHDNDVDNADYLLFVNCGTRSGVPWAPTAGCP